MRPRRHGLSARLIPSPHHDRFRHETPRSVVARLPRAAPDLRRADPAGARLGRGISRPLPRRLDRTNARRPRPPASHARAGTRSRTAQRVDRRQHARERARRLERRARRCRGRAAPASGWRRDADRAAALRRCGRARARGPLFRTAAHVARRRRDGADQGSLRALGAARRAPGARALVLAWRGHRRRRARADDARARRGRRDGRVVRRFRDCCCRERSTIRRRTTRSIRKA